MNYDIANGDFNGVIHSYSISKVPQLKFNYTTSYDVYTFDNIFDYNVSNLKHYCSIATNDSFKDPPFIQIEFPRNELIINEYSLSSHYTQNLYLQSWNFSASQNEVDWDILHSIQNSSDLISSSVGRFLVNDSNKRYRYFKLQMTGPTLSGDKMLRIDNIELFGILYTWCTCFIKKTVISLQPCVLIFLIN